MSQDLSKSLDELIDDIFAEDAAPLAKAEMDEKNKIAAEAPREDKEDDEDENKHAPTDADKNGAKKEGEEDEEEGKKRGRPEDLSAWEKRSPDGASPAGDDYESIQHAAKPVPHETTVAKSFTINAEEMELLKKAKAQKAEEELKKAKKEQEDLIKSAVTAATDALRKENEDLKKAMIDTQNLVKAMAKKPQPRKSISNIQVLEKSFNKGGEGSGPEKFSKSEMLDVAEQLMKSGKLTMEQVIELDDTGFIYDPNARALIERELRKLS